MNKIKFGLNGTNFYKWHADTSKLMIISMEVEDVAYFELSHQQAWILNCIDGKTSISSLAESFANIFGSQASEWEASLLDYFSSLEKYQIIVKDLSDVSGESLEIPPVSRMNPKNILPNIGIVRPPDKIIEVYAGTTPVVT